MPGNPWPAVSRKRSRSVRAASSIAMMRYLPTCQAPKVVKRWGWRTSLMICKARSSSGPIDSARHTNFSASSNPPGPVAFQTSPQPPRPSGSTSRYPSMGSAPASKVISIALASAFGSHPVEAPANACLVVIVLDRGRLAPPLPEMAAGPVVPVIAACVGRQQPLHPAPEVTVDLRAQDQMEVIGHQAIVQDIDGQQGSRVDHRLHEFGVILIHVEHRLAAIAPIHGVIPHPTDRRSCCSRHETSVNQAGLQINKALCPPLSRV